MSQDLQPLMELSDRRSVLAEIAGEVREFQVLRPVVANTTVDSVRGRL